MGELARIEHLEYKSCKCLPSKLYRHMYRRMSQSFYPNGTILGPLFCVLLFSLRCLFSESSPVTWVALNGYLDDCGRPAVWTDQPFP